MNKKKLILIMGIFICLLITGESVMGNTQERYYLEETIKEQLNELELSELNDYINLIDPEYQKYLPGLNWRDILEQIRVGISIPELLSLFIRTLFKEVIVSSYLLRQLLVISLLSAVLYQLQTSIGSENHVNIAFSVCFLILIFVGLQSFRNALVIANQAIGDMVSFMHALLPMMATLMASVGGITSAAIFHPMLVAVVGSIANLVPYLLFPLINASAVLGLLAHFSPVFPLSRLATLARQSCVILLSFFFVVFSGVMVVRGAIAPVADGVGLRTAKFLTRTFIPVIGGMFADAAEVVIGGSMLIKNTVGIFGLLMIFFIAVLPIIKIWAIVFIYKIVGALIQPICDERIVNALASLESSLTLILVAVATVALMFFLSVTILIGFGNLAVLMR